MGSLAARASSICFTKDLLLHVPRRVIVEIIQPDFAPGNDLGSFCQLFQFAESRIGRQLGFVGMNANGGVDEFVLLGQLDAAVQTSRPVTVANRDDRLYSCFSRPRDHLLAIGLELLAIEMSMGIDENRRWSLAIGCPELPSV